MTESAVRAGFPEDFSSKVMRTATRNAYGVYKGVMVARTGLVSASRIAQLQEPARAQNGRGKGTKTRVLGGLQGFRRRLRPCFELHSQKSVDSHGGSRRFESCSAHHKRLQINYLKHVRCPVDRPHGNTKEQLSDCPNLPCFWRGVLGGFVFG